MTEPTKEVKQDYIYHTDQHASVNAFLDVDLGGETFKLQITARYGASAEKISATTNALISALAKLREEHPKPEKSIPTPEPVRVNVDTTGNEQPEVKTFTADKLSVSMSDGKYYFKVVGKPFTQYGIPIWEEALKACNIDVTPGQPVPDVAGWRADYVEYQSKDGKKRMKVTRLLPPK